jgi:cephalosporin hydroxylase
LCGCLDEDLLAWYHAVAQVLEPGALCVEVGVSYGRSAIYLCEIIAALGVEGARVYAVDPYDAPLTFDRPFGALAPWGQILRGWCAQASDRELSYLYVLRARSVWAARMFPPAVIRMVMIDGDHSERAVAEDIEAWMPTVRPGGWLSGHDYSAAFPGVVAAVDAAFPDGVTVAGTVWAVEAPAGGF